MVHGITLFYRIGSDPTAKGLNSSGQISQDSPHWEFSTRSKRPWFLNSSVHLSNSKEGSSSCQCTMTLVGENEGNRENCIANAHRVTEYARRFIRGHGSFLGPGSEKKWYGTHVCKPDGQWDNTAEDMMLNFAESGHPIFRASSAFKEMRLETQRERKENYSHQRQWWNPLN